MRMLAAVGILTCISLSSAWSSSNAADAPAESPRPPVADKAPPEKPVEKKAEPKKKLEPDTPPAIEREDKTIEGWRVRFDKRLLTGPAAELGRRPPNVYSATSSSKSRSSHRSSNSSGCDA